jgi:hypothetical protein
MALDCSTSTGPHFALLTSLTYTLVGFRSLYNIYPRVVHASTSTPEALAEGKASDKIDEVFVCLFEQTKNPDADFEQIKDSVIQSMKIGADALNTGGQPSSLGAE